MKQAARSCGLSGVGLNGWLSVDFKHGFDVEDVEIVNFLFGVPERSWRNSFELSHAACCRCIRLAYWSRPGYFDEKDQAEQEAMCGRPEILVGSDSPVLGQIAAVLQRGDGAGFKPLEYRRLEELAKLLGVANALTAYEYLRDGETHGIKGWKKFVEVPAEAIDAEKQKALALRREKNRLRRQGLLLVEQNPRKPPNDHRVSFIVGGNMLSRMGGAQRIISTAPSAHPLRLA
jgi:hypothetical protein